MNDATSKVPELPIIPFFTLELFGLTMIISPEKSDNYYP